MSEQNRAKKRRTDMSSAASAAVAMDASQQFHLKWNNHSLNTLSSFQNLLDTNTLVDVSLTASNGKTVTAHRMVLAACSDYFYRLFKELPEKHPVIVFKDASEEIVSDLLLFMYKGEVEVQESHLNDFLKFADTLQVKGLSQSDREDISAKQQQDAAAAAAAMAMGAAAHGSPLKMEGSPIKINGPPAMAAAVSAALPTPPPPLPDMTKTYLAAAGLAKFPPIFPLPPGVATDPAAAAAVSATDLLSQFSSPNLYRALHNRNKQMGNHLAAAAAPGTKFNEAEASLLGGMPPLLNLKKMFAGDKTMAAAAADLANLYPHPLPVRDDNDSDSIVDHRSPPPAHQQRSSSNAGTPGPNDENGTGSDNGASPMEQDFSSSAPLSNANESPSSKGDREGDNTTQPRRGGSKPSAGRGSRLEKMIAAEYKIMSEYAENTGPNELPVMTPELMKSRRTHSLQLAIGEILHNRASVQSAATKYHIPRETLRRHYQRYLKTLGIARPPPPPSGGSTQGQTGGGSAPTSGTNTPASSAVRTAVTTNNNATKSVVSSGDGASSADESSNGFSSLMDIGQAYGIWNPDLDPELKSKIKDEAMRRVAAMSAVSAATAAAASGAEEKEKELVIDEDEDELDVGEEDDEFEDIDKCVGEKKNEAEEEETERDEEEKGDTKEPLATESSAAMETAA